jgi:hypothetical protein
LFVDLYAIAFRLVFAQNRRKLGEVTVKGIVEVGIERILCRDDTNLKPHKEAEKKKE